ncbi:hypothetical protein L226DRAFT_526438 [Lentinus tigrinus ALCF2SS1-7]|uniref:uncharacterized protein n=1 Tax=Lentinus tigrinus ALCF2SS1-7 TaxID=1328758 RepID=UPI0011660300|nr:hypothetical protein L226DRAFT_526438 [Lentinus tigrinus ALCF2SS1-7]
MPIVWISSSDLYDRVPDSIVSLVVTVISCTFGESRTLSSSNMNGESRTTFAMSSAEGRAVRQHPPRHIMRMKMRSSFPTSANDAVTTSVSLAPVPISVETTMADLSTEPPGTGLPTRSPRIVLAVRQADPTATYTPGLISAPITVAGTLQATALSFNTQTFGTNTGTESGVPLLQPSGSSDNGSRTSQTSSTSATSTPPPAPQADRVPVIVGSICGVLALVLLVALLITRFRHARLRKWKGPFMERIVAHRHRISLSSGGKRKDRSESGMKAPDERSSSPPPAYSWTAGQ